MPALEQNLSAPDFPERLSMDDLEVNMMKLVVVGGVAGGASAAARVRRLDAKAEIVFYRVIQIVEVWY